VIVAPDCAPAQEEVASDRRRGRWRPALGGGRREVRKGIRVHGDPFARCPVRLTPGALRGRALGGGRGISGTPDCARTVPRAISRD
jgi:hypothetical protein